MGRNNPLYKKDSVEETDLKDIKLVQYHEKQFSLYNHLGHIKEDIIYNGDSVSISYTNSDSFLTQLIKNTEYGCIGSSFVKNQYHLVFNINYSKYYSSNQKEPCLIDKTLSILKYLYLT